MGVVRSRALDDPGLQTAHNEFGGFIEAITRLVHIDAETVVLALCEAAPDTEQRPTVA